LIFQNYIGIDYSGAETPKASLKGLRVYMADRSSPPVEVIAPAKPAQVAVHPAAAWQSSSFLAVRRLGHSGRPKAPWLRLKAGSLGSREIGANRDYQVVLDTSNIHIGSMQWPASIFEAWKSRKLSSRLDLCFRKDFAGPAAGIEKHP
jgi:hypothetical protein